MTAYVGSGSYCYASTLATVAGRGWPPGMIETLTGSAFGFQTVEGVPYFDLVGWDPVVGLTGAEMQGRTCLGHYTEVLREVGGLRVLDYLEPSAHIPEPAHQRRS
jgi:hypothetical protein